jgi:hypothetical protein
MGKNFQEEILIEIGSHVNAAAWGIHARLPFILAVYPYQYKMYPMAFHSQSNYTDWETAVGQRSLMPNFADRGVSRGQVGGFLRLLISVF